MKHSRWLWNVFTVWLLTGIWHGANWTFILWGLAYFVLLVLEREAGLKLGHADTIICVVLLWVVFRCESVDSGVRYIASMFGLKSNAFWDWGFIQYVKDSWVIFVFSAVGIFPVMKFFHRYVWVEAVYLCMVLGLSVLEIINSSYNPFIYFNF